MGQSANPRRQKDNEAKAYSKYVKSSAQKLNVVAGMIRGQKAGKALTDLKFSTRRVSQDVYKVLQSAISNAENNHGLDVDRLIVAEAVVGKTLTMKRFHARGRGRAAQIEKKFSNILIIVREGEEAVAKKAKKAPAKKAAGETKQKAPAKKPAAKKSKAQGA